LVSTRPSWNSDRSSDGYSILMLTTDLFLSCTILIYSVNCKHLMISHWDWSLLFNYLHFAWEVNKTPFSNLQVYLYI
jgi:hypothetical protein